MKKMFFALLTLSLPALAAVPELHQQCRVTSVNAEVNDHFLEEGLGVYGDPDADSDSQGVALDVVPGGRDNEVGLGQMSYRASDGARIEGQESHGLWTIHVAPKGASYRLSFRYYPSGKGVVLYAENGGRYTNLATFDCTAKPEPVSFTFAAASAQLSRPFSLQRASNDNAVTAGPELNVYCRVTSVNQELNFLGNSLAVWGTPGVDDDMTDLGLAGDVGGTDNFFELGERAFHGRDGDLITLLKTTDHGWVARIQPKNAEYRMLVKVDASKRGLVLYAANIRQPLAQLATFDCN